jgi:hypothetical protein
MLQNCIGPTLCRGRVRTGDDITFTFTKPIFCEKPFCFHFSMVAVGLPDGVTTDQWIFDSDDFNILCSKNKISLAFNLLKVKLEDLMAKDFRHLWKPLR